MTVLNINELVLKCFEQQHTLANIDKSFIRVLPPAKGIYTRETIKEAMYYASCMQVEVLEYSEASLKDKLMEAVDVAIFGLNVLVYLGYDTALPEGNKVDIMPIADPDKVMLDLSRILATLWYYHTDYKQWKFPKENVGLSKAANLVCLNLVKTALSLLCSTEEDNEPSVVSEAMLSHIDEKMQLSIKRAQNEIKNKEALNV